MTARSRATAVAIGSMAVTNADVLFGNGGSDSLSGGYGKDLAYGGAYGDSGLFVRANKDTLHENIS